MSWRGDFIRHRRQSLKLTIQKTAEYVGVSKQTFSKWETGLVGDVSSKYIYRLCEVLRIDVASFTAADNLDEYYKLSNEDITSEKTTELRPILQELVDAASDKQDETIRLAISMLKAMK